MKRRVEEATKVEGIPPVLHAQRSPHTVSSVVQPAYPNIAKSAGVEVNSIQQYPITASYVSMPSITASVKPTGNLQAAGGASITAAASHTSGILVASGPFRHAKVQPSSGGTTPPTVVGTAGGGQSVSSAPAQQFQRLKVEDALSYLDQVKYKFQSQPQVYNDFLEIMKEFKSQCIDTPGVIARVSHLFKGYPELISGFNTFLPPGYKIEVQANDTGYSLQVSVSNPMGHQTMQEIPTLTPTQQHSVVVTNQTTKPPVTYTPTVGVVTNVPTTHLVKGTPSLATVERRAEPSPQVQAAALAMSGVATQGVVQAERSPPRIATVTSIQGSVGSGTPLGIAMAGTLASVTGGHPAQPPAALAAASVAVQPNSAAAATAVVLPPNHVPGPQQTSQPVEFNHAINYVNKIKNRFQGQPEKYKKFLEILHTYQKEQKNVKSANTGPVLVGGLVGSANSGKHLTEAEVYAQVAQLFEKHDDLLLEFGQFLPDATSHNSLSLASLVNTSNHHHSPKVTERKSTVNLKFGSGTVNRSEGNVRDRTERNERDNSGPREPVKTSPPTTGPKTLSGVKRSNEIFNNLPIGPNSPGSAAHPGPPGPVKRQKLTHPSTHSSFSHFEAIKRAFRNPGHYDQLLRCFYLFNLDLISRPELICLIAPLLSRLPDHLNYFRDYLGETGPIGPVHSSSAVAGASSTAESGRSPVSPPAVAPAHHPSAQPSQHHPHMATSSGHHNHHSHHGHHHHHSHHGNSQSNAASSSVSRDRDRDRDKDHIVPERERPLPLPLPLPPPLPPLGHGSLPPHMLDHHHPLSNTRLGLEPSRPDHATSAATADIDFSSCKRIGASYCALPKSAPPPRCSGRTLLCKQVLNDTWVSFPTWSEDSTFVTSRKTQYEEYIYRCEDERFELDLVIESNASTIVILENVQKKMSRMSPEELAKFTLDDNLGGTSSTIHIKAIRRIYGDKANDVIEGLKSNPSVAIPLVLRRLRYKENEWRHAQKGFNKTWRDQNEKFYLKSLDHQGINFKQSDLKGLRSKSLYNEIETAYDERHENDEGKTGPHIYLSYTDKNILDDAANLLIHHVKRQTGVHKQDKQRIKQLLRHSIPDMFHHRRQELSDDERDTDDKMDSDVSTNKENLGNAGNTPKGCNNNNNNKIKRETTNDLSSVCTNSKPPAANFKSAPSPNSSPPQEPPVVPVVKPEEHPSNHPDEVYTLFFGSNNWYLFIRLHQILCERLAKMSERSKKIADEDAQHSVNRKESTTAMLRLKPNEHWQDCYGSMLEMVKSVLDCSMESQTYEDTLRQMFGIHAYIGFTLDKIVIYAVRQLQYLVTDESCVECWDLHNTYRAKGGAGGPVATAEERAAMEANYMRAVTTCLSGENCYKICIYKKECKVTVELLDNESEEEEEGGGSDNGTADTKEKNGGTSSKTANPSKKWSDVDSRINSHSDRADSGTSSLNDKDRFTPIAPLYLRRLLKGKKDDSGESKNSKTASAKCFATGSLNDVIIIDKNDCLYKAGSIRRSRETHCKVTRRKFAKFSQWHQKWALREVSRTENEDATVWFMGRGPNTHPNVTKAVEKDPGDERPPFRKYNVYTVSRPASS